MDRVKRTQIQVKTILRDYRNMFSDIKDERELVETFKSLFTSSRNYWKHVLKHAVPEKVSEKLHLKTWKDAMHHSKEIWKFQKEYALNFLETLSFIEKLALQQIPGADIDRIIFFASRKRTFAIVLENSGQVASVFELDRFRNWEEWKLSRIRSGETIKEIPIDEGISKISMEIQKISGKFFGRN